MRLATLQVLGLLALPLGGMPTLAQARGVEHREYQDEILEQAVSPDQDLAARRRAIGLREGDLDRSAKKMNRRESAPPWGLLLIGLILVGAFGPVAWKMLHSTQESVDKSRTFGRAGGRPPARAAPAHRPPRLSRPAPPVDEPDEPPESTRMYGGPQPTPAESVQAAAQAEVRPPSTRLPGGPVPTPVEAPVAPEKPPAADASLEPRDAVWTALSSMQKWVTADWIALNAGLTTAQALEELGTLAEEGYIQAAKDKSGRQVFRMPEA